MGLPVARFVASTNANDVVPQYLRTGVFHPRAAAATLSNAMDVGSPNNFPRLLDLCRGRLEYVQREIWGHGATDEETLGAMKSLYERFHYIADPHTRGPACSAGRPTSGKTSSRRREFGAGDCASCKVRGRRQEGDWDRAAAAGSSRGLPAAGEVVAADFMQLR